MGAKVTLTNKVSLYIYIYDMYMYSIPPPVPCSKQKRPLFPSFPLPFMSNLYVHVHIYTHEREPSGTTSCSYPIKKSICATTTRSRK